VQERGDHRSAHRAAIEVLMQESPLLGTGPTLGEEDEQILVGALRVVGDSAFSLHISISETTQRDLPRTSRKNA